MRVEFFCSDDIDLFYLGQTLAGLYAQPDTTVRVRRAGWIGHPLSAAIEFEGLKLAIDVSDHNDFFNQHLLEWCDVYAKRNINPRRDVALQHKIIPFGLVWACHSRRSLLAALGALAATLPRASKTRLREVYRYLVTPPWKAFEVHPSQPVDSAILLQTRVWEPEDAPGDEIINDQRISLLRALKKEFGQRLVGGVVPSEFASRHCPDLITTQPCRHPQYVKWAKKPLIGIYFRGLFDAIPIKMAEYLAASKCIVSEPIHNELVEPLDHNFVFRSNDECLQACERILSDPQLALAHRQHSWDYYNRQVRPDVHIAGLLKRARTCSAARKG